MKQQGLSALRTFIAAFVFGVSLAFGAALAQQPPPSVSGSNPTELSVQEEALMQELNKLQGRISIPDGKLSVLQQPQGRDYRAFHESILPWIAGILILAMLALLVAFYLYRGQIRLSPDEKIGRKILRFNVFERFVHWLTATSFIVLAITGLNYFFGKRLLMPLLGADAFAAWSQWAKYAHNFVSWPFIAGVLLMIVVWVKDNLPDRYDAAWLKAGGFLSRHDPPAGRVNAGQKLLFWAVALGGIALSASGLVMLFPFSIADVNGMQIAQYVHSIVGVIMMAIILAHIYIGTIGMEGAWDAMGTGEVDLGWARRHHSAWVETLGGSHGRQSAKGSAGAGGGMAPASSSRRRQRHHRPTGCAPPAGYRASPGQPDSLPDCRYVCSNWSMPDRQAPARARESRRQARLRPPPRQYLKGSRAL